MATYLRQRNGHYYLRLRVPSDLTSTIPSVEVLKSLHTKSRKDARIAGARLHTGILEVFTLTRTGFISGTQAIERLATLLGRKQDKQPKVLYKHVAVSPPSIALSQAINTHKRDKASAWTAKTRLEYESYFRLMLNIAGDVDVTAIDRETVRNLRDTLTRLPANLYKKYPEKTIEQVLQLEGINPMSVTTVNKLLTLFGSVMRHCIEEGLIKTNPTEGLKVHQKRRPDEERKAYKNDDLKRIVTALPSPSDRPERHWIPLIGMLSGMRLGEICGLHVDDVKQIDGVWCFDVNDEDDKRLKNASSKRIIPIHPSLIDRGLLIFAEEKQRKGHVRMWPNLTRRETDGYCHAIGKWFQRFNRQHVTTDPLKTFHSLRHTFADTLKQAGVQETIIAELMGHANQSITTGRYGKSYRPQVLLEAVSKLDF